MPQTNLKPLNWEADPEIGYTVERRPDGGMHITFTDTKYETLIHWRKFAMAHLVESDRLTRNLYDLSALDHIGDETIKFAIEANSDPSARNIRLAIVVANEAVGNAMRRVAGLTEAPGGTEMKLFTDLTKAEAWLSQPLEIL